MHAQFQVSGCKAPRAAHRREGCLCPDAQTVPLPLRGRPSPGPRASERLVHFQNRQFVQKERWAGTRRDAHGQCTNAPRRPCLVETQPGRRRDPAWAPGLSQEGWGARSRLVAAAVKGTPFWRPPDLNFTFKRASALKPRNSTVSSSPSGPRSGLRSGDTALCICLGDVIFLNNYC